MSIKTHVVAPAMIAATAAAVISIAFAPSASALSRGCGGPVANGPSTAAMKRGGGDCGWLDRIFHDRDDQRQQRVPAAK